MYVRLAFSVAAHLEPEILVVDEVLAVGDTEFQKKCLGKMEDVAGEGRTVLFVSHSMSAIRAFCSRAMVLDRGRLVNVASVDNAIHSYSLSSVSLSQVPLDQRLDRRGSGAAKLTSIKLNHPSEEVAVGDILEFQIEFQTRQTNIKLKPWILFRNFQGDNVFMVMPSEALSLTISNSTQLICKFNSALSPGDYLISCGLLSHDGSVVDWIDDASTLTVASTFSSGQPYDQRMGQLTVLGTWQNRSC